MNKSNQYNDENSKKQKTENKTRLKTVEKVDITSGASKKEITQALNKIGKLKGEKKEKYVSELAGRTDSVAFATDMLKVLDSVISLNHKLDEQIVKGYQTTIERLLTRLDKLGGEKDEFEIKMIYNQIADLTQKIQQIHNDWQKILTVVIFGIFSLAGIAIKGRVEKH